MLEVNCNEIIHVYNNNNNNNIFFAPGRLLRSLEIHKLEPKKPHTPLDLSQ